MQDDQELEAEEAEEQRDEPTPDPWRERALAAETAQQQAMAALQQLLQQQKQPPQQQLQRVAPNYQEFAETHGMPVDQVKGLASIIGAEVAPIIEDLRNEVQALRPTDEQRIATIMEKSGWEGDDSDVVAAAYRARKKLGEQATMTQLDREMIADLKTRKQSMQREEPETRRTAGLSGGSIPRGARKAEAKAPETFVETIKKDQKKRGLYAY